MPGYPAASLLYQRVTEQDRARLMPPPHTNKKLGPEQIDMLRTSMGAIGNEPADGGPQPHRDGLPDWTLAEVF